MRIVSWNVNGLRSIHRKGALLSWLKRDRPDIVGLQETRAGEADLPPEIVTPRAFRAHFCCAERKGYSGTALYTRVPPLSYQAGLGVPEFDVEGRVQRGDFGAFVLYNVYFPNGSGVDRDNRRVPYKLAFYRRLLDEVNALRAAGREVIVMGDFNTAHREIDLKNWRSNRETSGFLDEERAEIERWLQTGLRDSFRHVRGDVQDAYSWWSVRQGVRERNIGWRIDLVLLTPGLLPHLRDAFILPHVMGSDHCPVGIDLGIELTAPPAAPARSRARKGGPAAAR